MTGHDHEHLVDGCFRCELNQDEMLDQLLEQDMDRVGRLIQRVRDFKAEMVEHNIHIGMGAPGRATCVVDGQPWPCTYTRSTHAD